MLNAAQPVEATNKNAAKQSIPMKAFLPVTFWSGDAGSMGFDDSGMAGFIMIYFTLVGA
jgi:hypothetical protein